MTRRIALAVAVLAFLFGAVAIVPATRSCKAQVGKAAEDTRKQPDFDPTQFPGEDLGPLLKDKKFTNGKHTLTTFPDGSKLTIETKDGKIRRAFLFDADGSRSDATIHSPSGPPTARRFTIGVHLGGGGFERCYICTLGRDNQQQSASAQTRERRRLISCHRAPCDDFYPEPDPPTIDPLKKEPSSKKGKN